MTAAAAMINRHDDPLLGGWSIELPHGEVKSMEPAHVYIINTQKNFRGKVWIKADTSCPIGDVNRYDFVLDRNTAAAINKRTERELFAALQRAFESNSKGIIAFFEETWRGGWYRGY